MLLALASVLFAVFVINVSIGSFGGSPFLGNVGEMLLLLAVSIVFVAAVLRGEADEKIRQ
ncbi:hypothetical protein LP7551_00378 [Roseibium album]|nr:hypothetical protein LP7551_00378 [Roseibium album]